MSNFEIYKKEIKRLLNKTQFGGNWLISFNNKYKEKNAAAYCQWNLDARHVIFKFNVKFNVKMSTAEIKKTARHEFGHFVTCRLDTLAYRRFTTEREIDEECEAIARVFEKLS